MGVPRRNGNSPFGGNFGPHWLLRYARADARGEVITFYSYKGGTGRSMAMTNCAGLLANVWPENAKPILMIDFDLEAPGLHQYLREYLPDTTRLHGLPGTLELFAALFEQVQAELARRGTLRLDEASCHDLLAAFDFSPYLIQTGLTPVFLIKAGRFDADYTRRLADMSWQGLYAMAPGLFRALAGYFSRHYACTLVDARTGLNDTSSICTMLLPDVLTVVFTPNRQSLSGVEHLIREAKAYRAQSSDLRPLRIYPLPSRVEQTSEDYRQTWRYGQAQHHIFGNVTGYQPMFAQLFQEIAEAVPAPDQLAAGLDHYFDQNQVPHSPDYAYGERLCFGEQAAKDRFSLRSTFETFLLWLSTAAHPWQEPHICLQALQLEDWLCSLALPAQNDVADTVLGEWLERIRVAVDNFSSLGLQAARDLLEWQDQNDNATRPAHLAGCLPLVTLLLAVAHMQAGRCDDARALFQDTQVAIDRYGLAQGWWHVPSRWLRLQVQNGNLVLLLEWANSGCAATMCKWLESGGLSRQAYWDWVDQVLAAFELLKLRPHWVQAMAQSLLATRSQFLDGDDPDVLRTYKLVAEGWATGESGESGELADTWLADAQKRRTLADTFQRTGEWPQAEQIYQNLLIDAIRIFGPTHPNTATCFSDLMETMKQSGNRDGMGALFSRYPETADAMWAMLKSK